MVEIHSIVVIVQRGRLLTTDPKYNNRSLYSLDSYTEINIFMTMVTIGEHI